MIARMLSRTARRSCSSVAVTPFSSAFSVIFLIASLATASDAIGHSPVSAAVFSSDGIGGQSARAQLAPDASRVTAVCSSPRPRKNSSQAASTAAGSFAHWP